MRTAHKSQSQNLQLVWNWCINLNVDSFMYVLHNKCSLYNYTGGLIRQFHIQVHRVADRPTWQVKICGREREASEVHPDETPEKTKEIKVHKEHVYC